MTSMEESAMKGPELNGSDAANQNHRSVVSVEGYDTWLQPYYVRLILEKHFSSCGNITGIYLVRDEETGLLKSSATIFFRGEGADDKALELSGDYVEGWNLIVGRENYSDYESDGDGDYEDEEEEEEDEEDEKEKKEEDRRMIIFGFDTSASEIDVKIKLCKHFSSCGEVTDVLFCGLGSYHGKCFAYVDIRGQDATDKARKLSDCDLDGGNIRVGSVLPTYAEHEQRVRKNTHELNTTGHYDPKRAYMIPTD